MGKKKFSWQNRQYFQWGVQLRIMESLTFLLLTVVDHQESGAAVTWAYHATLFK